MPVWCWLYSRKQIAILIYSHLYFSLLEDNEKQTYIYTGLNYKAKTMNKNQKKKKTNKQGLTIRKIWQQINLVGIVFVTIIWKYKDEVYMSLDFFSLCVKPKLVFVTFVGILISRKQLCIPKKFKDQIRKKYIFSTWKMRTQIDEAKQFRTHTEMFCE